MGAGREARDVATDEGMPGGSDTLLPDIDRALKLLNNRKPSLQEGEPE